MKNVLARLTLCLAVSGLALGAGWTEVDTGIPRLPAQISGVVIDPSSPSTVYAFGPDLFQSKDGGGTWKILGGVSGVSAFAIDPGDSSRLYAAAHGTVLQSWDGGQTWGATGFNQDSAVALAIDPQNGATLYALTFDAVFKSTDRGATWADKTPVVGDTFHGASIAVHPTDSSTIYVSGSGLYKSTDGGDSWQELMAGNEFCSCPVAIDPTDPSTVYATLLRFDQPEANGNVFRLFKSTDAGETWNLSDAGIPGFPNSIVIDPSSAVYASYIAQQGDSNGVVKSTDGGASWSAINTGLPSNTPPINSLALDPGKPSTIFAGYSDVSSGRSGVFLTFDGGSTWNDAGAGLTAIDLHALAVDPTNPATVYAAASGGISKTSDGGANWQTVPFSSPGPGAAVTLSLLIDPNNPQVVYASVEGAGGCFAGEPFLRKSTDGGTTWTDLSPTYCTFGSTVSLAFDPVDSNTLYAAPEDIADCGTPLDVSSDGGTSWNQSYISGFVTALAVDPFNRTTLYAGTSEWPRGLLKSTDSGTTWGATGLTDVDVGVLAVDPVSSGVLYAAIASAYPDGVPGLVKSSDGGATWSPINTGLEGIIGPRTPITALVVDSKNAALYLGTSGAGVFRSGDGGARWTALNDGLPSLNVQAVAVSPDGSGTLYAGTPSGVFRTVDSRPPIHRR
jgi:photosystem II stability/assembly factor-like uncharacterized protein